MLITERCIQRKVHFHGIFKILMYSQIIIDIAIVTKNISHIKIKLIIAIFVMSLSMEEIYSSLFQSIFKLIRRFTV